MAYSVIFVRRGAPHWIPLFFYFFRLFLTASFRTLFYRTYRMEYGYVVVSDQLFTPGTSIFCDGMIEAW